MSDEVPGFPDEAMQQARERRDACPDAAELAKFAAGERTGERAREIAEHLDFCGICELLVGRLGAADVEKDGEMVDLRDSKARIAAGLRPLLEEPDREMAGGVRRRWWLSPVFAYSVAAAAFMGGYLAPRGTEAGPSAPVVIDREEPRQTIGRAQRVELDQSRSAGEEARVRTSDVDLVLSFVLPVRRSSEYTAALIDGQDRVRSESQRVAPSADGYFYVVVPRERVERGRWRLRVMERGGATGREFDFPFVVE